MSKHRQWSSPMSSKYESQTQSLVLIHWSLLGMIFVGDYWWVAFVYLNLFSLSIITDNKSLVSRRHRETRLNVFFTLLSTRLASCIKPVFHFNRIVAKRSVFDCFVQPGSHMSSISATCLVSDYPWGKSLVNVLLQRLSTTCCRG